MVQSEFVDSKYKSYLGDLGPILKELALEHRAERDAAAADSEQRAFSLGVLMGFHEVISILQQQADAFQIGRQELGLEDIEPDRDLV